MSLCALGPEPSVAVPHQRPHPKSKPLLPDSPAGLRKASRLPTKALRCPPAVRAGLRKAFRLPTTPAEILQANVDKEALPTRVVAETGAMARLLASFHAGLDEVTLVASPERAAEGAGKAVRLVSFIDPQHGGWGNGGSRWGRCGRGRCGSCPSSTRSTVVGGL